MELRDLLALCRVKGMREWFELQPKVVLPMTGDEPEHVRYAINRCNGKYWRDDGTDLPDLQHGELYMERNASAQEMHDNWTTQGYTAMIIKMSPPHYLGPRFQSKLKKIVDGLNIGNWTMALVEYSWSVVIATENPDDIKAFAGFIKS